ncbi:BnaA01g05310D [Brassica napus]|uniref:BnaA01g05310D protein n=1 Tax=Brassica napus TaxID=3708 RepID=A0A078HX47_BRANA|nr:BnaA01g05310D [Brassica napus]
MSKTVFEPMLHGNGSGYAGSYKNVVRRLIFNISTQP